MCAHLTSELGGLVGGVAVARSKRLLKRPVVFDLERLRELPRRSFAAPHDIRWRKWRSACERRTRRTSSPNSRHTHAATSN